MILTPIDLRDVPAALAEFSASLMIDPIAARIFARIADSVRHVRGVDISLSQDPDHHRSAVALVQAFSLVTRDESPHDGFSWDGQSVAIRMEPSVLVHEVAHYQLASPTRRHHVDFGMGAGPETGLRTLADDARTLPQPLCEVEESLVSLLGILWEAHLAQPAVLAFLEQNWLEGGPRPHNRDHFIRMAHHLLTHDFIDESGHPRMTLRQCDDPQFYQPFDIG